jgi:starch phosphorylase
MKIQLPSNDAQKGRPRPNLEGHKALEALALDLRWSWNHATDEIWCQLDPELWEVTHNPWVVLQTVSDEQIKIAMEDLPFRNRVEDHLRQRQTSLETPAWFQQKHSQSPLTNVAYFSMEFMLSEALPIYSGGLGNVAGDQLKAASDLGVPVIGIGLLYQQGYFRQVIDKNGEQQALYPYNDPGQMPIAPVTQANGERLRLRIDLPGYPIWLSAWQVQVGRLKLYLLDSNDVANLPRHRAITSQLYGGGPELRLQQEILLGIGGWRLLRALGIEPEVCHLNEGHAALAVLERARSFAEDTVQPFEVAMAATRAGNLFTTHTAVEAGFDRFEPSLVKQYLGHYAEQRLGIALQDLLALGRQNPSDESESFNMAFLAIRGCGAVNGVSQLHGEVSRRLFQRLFPGWPQLDVPVGFVTNGVHMPSWDSAAADELWTNACGKERWLGAEKSLEEEISAVSDATLWGLRKSGSTDLIEYTRKRLSRELESQGASKEDVEEAGRRFDPDVLTLGFARRFATYKRPDLLLHNPERLLTILTNPKRPAQLLLAGKAHPADLAGQALIHEWIQFIRRPEVRSHVAFLSDYDMMLTQHLVQGVDVWINTPRRPWEASGTSGMKVLVNGGLNLSELDGWWAEAYTPEVGWPLGDLQVHGENSDWDAAEAETLYDLLENEIVPAFYDRDPSGVPTAWTKRMRASMGRLTPQFAADRSVRQYVEEYYLPAATGYRVRCAEKGAQARAMVARQKIFEQAWASIHFGKLTVKDQPGKLEFEVEVSLNGLGPQAVRVELYANPEQGGVPGNIPVRREMNVLRAIDGPAESYIYGIMLSSGRPSTDFTPRIICGPQGLNSPLEETRILWQR